MVMGSLRQETETVVVGGGPGGYVAAIRLADLGKEVILVEERANLGGVCLLEGCIPSKTLIHATQLLHTMEDAKKYGISFKEVSVELDGLRKQTRDIVAGLSDGVRGLLSRRGVEVIHGRATLESATSLRLEGCDVAGIDFRQAILATGSRIHTPPFARDMGLWSSTDALSLPEIPKSLVVVGGGYIGLEMGLVYAGLGSRVTLVEYFPRLLAGADPDLVDVVTAEASRRMHQVLTGSKVTDIQKNGSGFQVTVTHEEKKQILEADRILMAVGRRPNTRGIGLESVGISCDDNGFLHVDETMRSPVKNLFAIGDMVPGPMLAHKASREGRVAAEVIANHPSAFDNRAIPAVVFTDPELAWVGLTQSEAQQQKRPVKIGKFPLRALGRARTLGQTQGFVKTLSDPDSGLLLGAGMVGPHVSELIAEATLAIEMGATLEDLMVSIHPHPTMSEALQEAAEVAAGTAIHVDPPSHP